MRMLRAVRKLGIELIISIFGYDAVRTVYRHLRQGSQLDGSYKQWFLCSVAKVIFYFVNLERFHNITVTEKKIGKEGYDIRRLNAMTHNIYNLPKIEIVDDRVFTINVLVPAFNVQTMSAGFFGVFQLALQISRMGFHVRLVMFENFYYCEKSFAHLLSKTTGLDTLLKEVEVCYIGDRYKSLKISCQDLAVATVWYSAYFAKKISLLNQKPFLYLIQDYEAGFYPCNTLYALADATYSDMNYYGIVSSKPLFDFLKKLNKCGDKFENNQMIFFNNASVNSIICRKKFMERRLIKTRKFVFYSRPAVDRNMFSLASLAIIESFKQGVFDTGHNWEFHGMGIGCVEIYLDKRSKIVQIPRMSLEEYEAIIQSFDICLTLMASPHPSLIPFDLASGGAVVVTNVFGTKDREYFGKISKNIIAVPPRLEDLVTAIKEAVRSAELFENRYEQAINMKYPKSWKDTWTPKVKTFINNALREYKGPRMLDQNHQMRINTPEAIFK